MSPRMRETEHDSCGAATTSSMNNNHSHSKGHSYSSQQDSQGCYLILQVEQYFYWLEASPLAFRRFREKVLEILLV